MKRTKTKASGYIVLWKGNLLTKSGHKGIEEMVVVCESDAIGMHPTKHAANIAIEHDRDGTPWHRDDYTVVPLIL